MMKSESDEIDIFFERTFFWRNLGGSRGSAAASCTRTIRSVLSPRILSSMLPVAYL